MNHFAVALGIGVLLAGAAARGQESGAEQQAGAEREAATEDGGFANQLEKDSYALGYNFGMTLMKRKVEVDPEQLLAGLSDGVSGRAGRLSENEVVVLTQQIQNTAMRRMQEEREALAAKNRAEGEAFRATNKDRPGVVTLPSGLQYEVLKEGNGPKPKVDDTVKVHHHGTLIDGTVFDSSRERGEPIVVRPDRVIPGWTEALPMMPVGSIWRLVLPPELAFGENTGSENIPPGATLTFEVELLSIEPPAAENPAPDETTPEGASGSQG